MRKQFTAVALAIAAIAAPIGVQAQSAGAGAVVAKEPGKVAMAEAVRVSATVQAIDKDERRVTLKRRDGSTFVSPPVPR